jgi:hypothetical protein
MPKGWDMLGSLRDFAPRIKAWSMDRSDDQIEGERLLEQHDYPGAELHLTKAVLESEKHQSASRKILLRLELAEAQRKQFRPPNAEENPEKLTAAEQSARSALEVAKTADPAALVQCLDALTEILAERGNYPEVELLTQPENIFWCDGSERENDFLISESLKQEVLIKLNQKKAPRSYLHRSNPNDVARVEQFTFICTPTKAEAGPTNNWSEPAETYSKLQRLLKGAMRGRTMFVVPYIMGPPDSPLTKIGFEIWLTGIPGIT